MNKQTAANIIPYTETSNPFELGSTSGDPISNDVFYKNIVDDFSVKKEEEANSGDTTYFKSDIGDLLPLKIPNLHVAAHSLSVLQEWEGYVVSISKETFTARLTDVTRKCTIEDEEADIPLNDLEDADRLTISPGAIFRWVIGYRRSPGGTKDRLSRIVFRNLPAWTTKELEKKRRDAVEWESQLKVD